MPARISLVSVVPRSASLKYLPTCVQDSSVAWLGGLQRRPGGGTGCMDMHSIQRSGRRWAAGCRATLAGAGTIGTAVAARRDAWPPKALPWVGAVEMHQAQSQRAPRTLEFAAAAFRSSKNWTI